MSLKESFDELEKGFSAESGLGKRAARWAAVAFFAIAALAFLALVGGAIAILTRPELEATTGVPSPILAGFLIAAVVLGVSIASLGRRLSDPPSWFWPVVLTGLAAGVASALILDRPVAGLVVVIAVGLVVLTFGRTRNR